MAWAYVAMAVLTAASVQQSHQANKANRRAREEAYAGQVAERNRDMRSQIREQRIRQAQILQRSQAAGTSESSGEVGALGNLSTNLSSNIEASIGRAQVARNISIFEQQAADSMSRAGTYQALGQVAGMFSSSSQPKKNTTPQVTPLMD